MKDRKWIMLGLIAGLGLFTFPFWFNLGHNKPFPKIIISEQAGSAGRCLRPAKQMRAEHMRILDQWRDRVVRHGERNYISPDGREYKSSLSNTCLQCHDNREEFCDRCHNYASVRIYCWDCHTDPARGFKEIAQWKTAEEISLR